MNFSSYIINKIKQTPLNVLVKDGENREIVKGAGTTFILKILGFVFSYGFNIYFARVYGAEIMGIFALSITVASFFSLFAQMGTQTSLVRFVAQYAGQNNFTAVKQVYKLTLKWVLPLSILLTILFYFLSPVIANTIFHKPKLVIPLKITTFVLPFGVFMNVNTASLRGLKKIKDAFIFGTVLPPVLNTIGLMGLTYFVIKSYLTPIYVNLITAFIGAVYSLYLWQKRSSHLPKSRKENDNVIDAKEIIKVSAPMFMTSAMLLIMGMTDTFILGMFRTSSEVGVYRVALKLALFTSFTLGAVNSIAAPKFSELYWKNENKKLKNIAIFSSKISFFSSLPILLVIFLLPNQILLLFGREFTSGRLTLEILNCMNFIIIIFGPIGMFLSMVNKQVVYLIFLVIGSISNLGLNYLLIPIYGINGAAAASLISTLIWRLSMSIYCRIHFGFWVGYLPFIKIKRRNI